MNLNDRSGASGSIINQYHKNEAHRIETQKKRSNVASRLTHSTANIGIRNAEAIKRRAQQIEDKNLNANNARAKNAHKMLKEEYKILSDNLTNTMSEFDAKYDTTVIKANLLHLKQQYEENKDKNNEQTTKTLQMYLTRSIGKFNVYIKRNPVVGNKVKELLIKILSTGVIEKSDISDAKVKEMILFIIPLLVILKPFVFRVLPYSDDLIAYSKTLDKLSDQAENLNSMQGGNKGIELTTDNIKKFYMFQYGKNRENKVTMPIVFIVTLIGLLLGNIPGVVIGLFIATSLAKRTIGGKIQSLHNDWIEEKLKGVPEGYRDTARENLLEEYKKWETDNKESYATIVAKGKEIYNDKGQMTNNPLASKVVKVVPTTLDPSTATKVPTDPKKSDPVANPGFAAYEQAGTLSSFPSLF